MYSQLQGQIGQMEESLKDQAGTIETLERQLVQAGIKQKVMAADVEINKKKEQVKSEMGKEYTQTEGEQKLLRGIMQNNAKLNMARSGDMLQNQKKDLEKSSKSE